MGRLRPAAAHAAAHDGPVPLERRELQPDGRPCDPELGYERVQSCGSTTEDLDNATSVSSRAGFTAGRVEVGEGVANLKAYLVHHQYQRKNSAICRFYNLVPTDWFHHPRS